MKIDLLHFTFDGQTFFIRLTPGITSPQERAVVAQEATWHYRAVRDRIGPLHPHNKILWSRFGALSPEEQYSSLRVLEWIGIMSRDGLNNWKVFVGDTERNPFITPEGATACIASRVRLYFTREEDAFGFMSTMFPEAQNGMRSLPNKTVKTIS